MKDNDVILCGGDRKGSDRGNLSSLLQDRQCMLRVFREKTGCIGKEILRIQSVCL